MRALAEHGLTHAALVHAIVRLHRAAYGQIKLTVAAAGHHVHARRRFMSDRVHKQHLVVLLPDHRVPRHLVNLAPQRGVTAAPNFGVDGRSSPGNAGDWVC